MARNIGLPTEIFGFDKFQCISKATVLVEKVVAGAESLNTAAVFAIAVTYVIPAVNMYRKQTVESVCILR